MNNDITFGGRCEKHLSVRPCAKCASDNLLPGIDRRATRKADPVTQKQIMELIYHYADCRIAYHGQGPEVRAAVVAVKAALTEAGIP